MILIATKPLTYMTRRLRPGDEFEAKTRQDARLLKAIGKAEEKRIPGAISPPPASLKQKISSTAPKPAPATAPDQTDDELKSLRAEYEEVLGKRPFHGWGADVLREKIAEAQKG